MVGEKSKWLSYLFINLIYLFVLRIDFMGMDWEKRRLEKTR